ncbi:hypothetical protein ACSRUE_09530 [Sorangium sp. KYC3313]
MNGASALGSAGAASALRFGQVIALADCSAAKPARAPATLGVAA